MSHPNKVKGTAFEREVVKIARERGFPADRTWGSDGRSRGLPKDVDVIIDGENFQCKRHKKIPDWLRPGDDIYGQIIREDRGEIYLLLPFDLFLDLFEGGH